MAVLKYSKNTQIEPYPTFSVFAEKAAILLLAISLATLYPSTGFAQKESDGWLRVKTAVERHYSNDTLKLKAAHFLFRNIPYHSTRQSALLDSCYEEIAAINRNYRYPDCINAYNALYDRVGDPNKGLVNRSDTETLTASSLISNIDGAFEAWRDGPYARHLTFDDFCEYLLPYRVGEENLDGTWRTELSKKYAGRIGWMQSQDDKCHSAYWAALFLNDQIKQLGFHVNAVFPTSEVELPLKVLNNMRMGECTDYARLTAYIMRACGIPVGIDFTPQWPFRSSGHHWNTLLDNSGRNVPFMGGESNPGYPCKAGYTMAKVFRRTFAYQPQSLFALKGDERVPDNLNNPFIKDVSDEYLRGRDVKLHLEKRHRSSRFAYLSAFDNQSWVPVDYSVIDKDGVTEFRSMGCGIVYLPVYWGSNGSVQADYPVELKSDGEQSQLIPDMKRTQDITMNRKFPVFGDVLYYSERMVNGVFEASNSPDFRDSVRCAVITRNPMMRYDSVVVQNVDRPYRYWRYVSPPNGYCNVAEIMFLAGKSTLQCTKIISDGKTGDGYRTEYAFDHDELTFYESNAGGRGWIGVDMGKPVSVDKIKFIPRGDDNNVVIGHTYGLEYYDRYHVKSLGMQVAMDYNVTFRNVPSSALYILHDLTKGHEERIFTYDHGKINWY
jgi:hypothetical protein